MPFSDLPPGAVVQFGDLPPGAVVVGGGQSQSMLQRYNAGLDQPPMLGEEEDDGFSLWDVLFGAAKSAGAGIARGVVGLAEAPYTLPAAGINAVGRMFGADENIIETPPYIDYVEQGLDTALYEPQGEGEQAIQNIASFLPGALLGPGGAASNMVRFGLLPGVISEGAGQVFDDTSAEGAARTAGALVGGGLGLIGRGGASRAAQHMLPEGVTQADLAAAERLMTSADAMGINLTWPEALNRATNGRVNVTDVQRFIESSRGGAPVMADVMSQRPGQVAGAVESQTRTMGPQVDFARAGLRVQNASEGAVTALRQRINASTEHLYQQAGGDMIHPMQLAQFRRDPLFEQALDFVRNDPVYMRATAGYPDGSVQVLNEIKKYLDDIASSSSARGENYAAGVYGGLSSDVRNAGTAASPPYAAALSQQANLRQTVLNPVEQGPLGQMSRTSAMDAQLSALFPRSPFVGSERVVGDAVQRVAARDPVAAQNLVRGYLEREFDDASRRIMGGENQWSGARFANEVAGSSQQAFNLQTAVTAAFPDGAQRWAGFQELLRVLQATGTRQRPGSATQANMSFSETFSQGGRLGETATTIASPNKALRFVSDTYRNIQLTGNTRRLAEIMTDPNAGPLLAQLLGARNVFEKTRIAAAILYQTNRADEVPFVGAQDGPPMLIPQLP